VPHRDATHRIRCERTFRLFHQLTARLLNSFICATLYTLIFNKTMVQQQHAVNQYQNSSDYATSYECLEGGLFQYGLPMSSTMLGLMQTRKQNDALRHIVVI